MEKFIPDFHLFDGEAGGAETASTPAAESSQESRIEYGRPRGEAQERQVGTDNSAQGEDLNAEFAELIGKGGRYHDVYGQLVSNTIQQRFKNQQDLKSEMDGITDGLMPLFMSYDLKPGDYDGLKNAIANDDAFYRANAEREGIDVDQYKKNLSLKAEAEKGRQITEAFQEQQRQNELFATWDAQATELKQAFPNFDLALEIENNEAFARQIDAGVDVQTAFIATHLNEILAGYDAEANKTATQNVVNTIQARAMRPVENGLMRSPAIQRRTDPSTLTDEDLDEINRRVAMGETISF